MTRALASHKSLSILLVLALIFSSVYFVLPSRVQGASLTITVSPTTQFVGGTVSFEASTTLGAGEDITSANVKITGDNGLSVTKSLPLDSAEGEVVDLGDGVTATIREIFVSGETVPSTTVPSATVPSFTVPVLNTTGITWDIDWKTPALLPANLLPPPPAGPLTDPDQAFPVPNAAGFLYLPPGYDGSSDESGGLLASPLMVPPDLPGIEFKFSLPNASVIPGALPAGTGFVIPLDMTVDPFLSPNGALYILAEGTTNDVVAGVDPSTGTIIGFFDTGVPDAVAIAFEDQTQSLSKRLFVASGAAGDTITQHAGNAFTFDFGDVQGSSFLAPVTSPISGLAGQGSLFAADFVDQPDSSITIVEFDPTNISDGTAAIIGSAVGVDTNQTGNGFDDIAFKSDSNTIFGVGPNGLVAFVDPATGEVNNIFFTTLNNVEGVAVIGTTLYFVNSDPANDGVFASEIPTAEKLGEETFGGGDFGTTPKALASNASELFIVVAGNPDIMVVVDPDTGSVIRAFNLPSGNIEGAAVIPGSPDRLFVTDQATVVEINPANGSVIATRTDFSAFFDTFGALGTDGTNLFGYLKFDDVILRMNPNNTGGAGTGLIGAPINIFPSGGFFPLGGADGASTGSDLFVGKFNTIQQIDLDTGTILNQFFMNPVDSQGNPEFPFVDISGIAKDGDTFLISDSANNVIWRATKPGVGAVETTTAGSYNAVLEVTHNPTQTSSPAAFTLTTVGAMDISITSPSDGVSFTVPGITVTGDVNDPTVGSVTVGIALPSTTLFETDFETSAARAKVTTTGLWNILEQPASGQPDGKKSIGDFSAYYGNPSGPNKFTFQTPSNQVLPEEQQTANSGNLDTETFTVTGTTLSFETWWDAEDFPDFDRPLIQACTSDTLCTTLGHIAGFTPPGQFGIAPGTVFPAPPGAPFPGPFIFLPTSLFEAGDPKLTKIELPLDGFSGQTIFIRFRFETLDPFVNFFEGWYVDDIKVLGAGLQGVTVATTGDPAFSTGFTLAEGSNTITASAANTVYDTTLTDSDSVTVFLDTTAPIVTLDAVTALTNDPFQTITGTFVEPNPSILQVFVNKATKPAPVLKVTTFTGTTFSVAVTLSEGSNLVEVELEDGSGATGTDSATVTLDTSPPTITGLATIFPLGETSARPPQSTGDAVIFQVDTSADAVSVEGFVGGSSIGLFDKTSSIPSAVVDKFGITGDFVLLTTVPQGVPPLGLFTIDVTSLDGAGNPASSTVSAKITPALEAFNRFLLTGGNFVGLPIQPDSSDIATLIKGIKGKSLATGITSTGGTTLTDSDKDFTALSVEVGDKVVNTGTSALTTVTAVGTTTLTLADNIFSASDTYDVRAGVIDTIQFFDGTIVTGGTNTSASSNKLVDSAAKFVSGDGLGGDIPQVGDRVTNDSTSALATITAIDNETTLSLDKDIFTSTSQVYTIRLVPDPGTGSTREARGAFQVFSVGPAFDTLTDLGVLKAYWFFTKTGDFDTSAPIAIGFPSTPSPVKFSYTGVLIKPGEVPSTRNLPAGWSAVTILSEDSLQVSNAFRSLINRVTGQRTDVSRIRFRNDLSFNFATAEITFITGAFDLLSDTDTVDPGDGVWVFNTNATTLVPSE